MSTSKTYTVAGVSTSNGKTKVRFANDYVSRFKILNKNGHTNVNLLELSIATVSYTHLTLPTKA